MRVQMFGLVAAGAVLVGCASGPTTSTVTGTIDQASFSSRIAKIAVVDDAGTSKSVAIAADGSFKLTLDEGNRYQLFLGADGKSLPIVTNAADGRLETQVIVESGGASADIGAVRYLAGVETADSKSTGVVVTGPSVAPATACLKGVVVGTTKPCTSGAATVACAGEDGHGDDHHDDFNHDHSMYGHDSHGYDNHGDSHSVAADPSTDASVSESVGIPELSITSLSCGCVGM